MHPHHALALAPLLLTLVACGPPHITPFTAKQRAYKPGEYAQTSAKPAVGSLYTEALGGYLEDTRATRVGDTVTVVISEAADGQGTATTTLNRTSSAQVGAELFGVLAALHKAHPGIEPAKLLSYASTSAFSGDASTQRNGQLTASIGVRVSRMLPNGDLFIEGTKVMLINNEEHHLYISGVVRPADIAQDNTVASSRIADAQLEFTGRGDASDVQRKGWLARALDAANPF